MCAVAGLLNEFEARRAEAEEAADKAAQSKVIRFPKAPGRSGDKDEEEGEKAEAEAEEKK